MKRALIIANMLFASATVFGMQQRDFASFLDREALARSLISILERSEITTESDSRRDLLDNSTQRGYNQAKTLIRDHLIQNHYDAERHLLDLSNQNLYMVPWGVGEIEDLEEVNLSNNNLESLLFFPNNFDNVRRLNISGNDFLSLCGWTPPSSLEELTLDGRLLKDIPDDCIDSITNIHGIGEGKTSVRQVVDLLLAKKNNYRQGNKQMLQTLGGVCTVRLKRTSNGTLPMFFGSKLSDYFVEIIKEELEAAGAKVELK